MSWGRLTLPRPLLRLLAAAVLFGPLLFGFLGLSMWLLVPLALIGASFGWQLVRADFPADKPVKSYFFTALCIGGGMVVLYGLGRLIAALTG